MHVNCWWISTLLWKQVVDDNFNMTHLCVLGEFGPYACLSSHTNLCFQIYSNKEVILWCSSVFTILSQEENYIKQKAVPCSSPCFWAENNMAHIYRNSHLLFSKSCLQCAYEFPLSLKTDTVKIVFIFLNSCLSLLFLIVLNWCFFTLGLFTHCFEAFYTQTLLEREPNLEKKIIITD